jgi:hypothetical protein
MSYLRDLWIWLSFAMGLGWMGVGSVLAWCVARYAGPDSRLPVVVRIAAVLLGLAYTAGVGLYCIGYLQRRFANAVDPYTTAYILGSLLGFPLVLWLPSRGHRSHPLS